MDVTQTLYCQATGWCKYQNTWQTKKNEKKNHCWNCRNGRRKRKYSVPDPPHQNSQVVFFFATRIRNPTAMIDMKREWNVGKAGVGDIEVTWQSHYSTSTAVTRLWTTSYLTVKLLYAKAFVFPPALLFMRHDPRRWDKKIYPSKSWQ